MFITADIYDSIDIHKDVDILKNTGIGPGISFSYEQSAQVK